MGYRKTTTVTTFEYDENGMVIKEVKTIEDIYENNSSIPSTQPAPFGDN